MAQQLDWQLWTYAVQPELDVSTQSRRAKYEECHISDFPDRINTADEEL